MREQCAIHIAALALFLVEVAGVVARGGADQSLLSPLEGLGATAAVALVCGLVASLLLRFARTDGPIHQLVVAPFARGARPARLALAVIAGLVPCSLAVGTRVAFWAEPTVAASFDLVFAVLALTLARLVLGSRSVPVARPRPTWQRGLPLLAAAVGLGVCLPARGSLLSMGLWDLVAVGVLSLGALGIWLVVPWPDPSGAHQTRLMWIAVGTSLALAVASIVLLHRRPDSRDGAILDARPARWVLSAAAAWDLDGDGFSPLLGGGDCDDHDPDVSPDAPELPGDGVDQNCRRGDRIARSPDANRPGFARLPLGVSPPEHIVLLTIDTLRADHLGAWGYERDTSPHLDALARRSVVFERAYTPAPFTQLAIPALLSGRPPSAIPWNRATFPAGFPRGMTTVAGLARRAGLRTGAVVSHRWFSDEINWTEGFEEVDRTSAMPYGRALTSSTGPAVVRQALTWQGRHRDERTLLWLHLYDPHGRYVPHAGQHSFGQRRVDLYDGEILWTDAAVGSLLRGLADLGIAEQTAMLVTSDHGEQFGEHGGSLHGNAVWEELVHVPLLVNVPGVEARRVRCVTSTLDVSATLLNLAGVDARANGLGGATLVPELTGRCDVDRAAVVELRNGLTALRALVTPRYKLIHDLAAGTYSLYDLAADPREERNVRDVQASTARALARRLHDAAESSRSRELQQALSAGIVDAISADAAPVGAHFGAVELVAADLGSRRLARGQGLSVTLYWRVSRRPPRDCQIVLRFLGEDGRELERPTDRYELAGGILRFSHLPRGKIFRDVHQHEAKTRQYPKPIQVGLGLRCDGELLAFRDARALAGHDALVDLGSVRADGGRGRGR